MAHRNHVEAQVARSNRERKICAGCKGAIMPGKHFMVRGKRYHEQCVWRCVGHGYGNHRPIEVTPVTGD